MGCALDYAVGHPDECCIESIAVDERFRKMGIGQLLLQRAEYEAKQNDCHVSYIGL